MKRAARFAALLLCAALLLGSVGCFRKAASRPLLWKATEGDGHTLYLFGTIHVGNENSDAVLQQLSPVLESCDALAVEFDVIAYQNSPAYQNSLQPFLLTDGTTIRDHLPDDLYTRACALLKEAGADPDAMQEYNLAMWAQTVESAAITARSDLDPDKAMDLLLIGRAYEKGIPVLDIESAEYQLALLSSFDEEVYLSQIQTTLDSLDLYGVSLAVMYAVWLSGNRDTLWSLVAQQTASDGDDLSADFSARLVDERNANMAEKAKEYLNSGKTVFFAVGAAHMAGDAGVVQLLLDAGYTVEETKY